MKATHPHFLLFSEASSAGRTAREQWRFVLQSLDQDRVFSASDQEPEATGERLELLAVVRGLEALSEPSRVTLVTKSRYVSQGISRGLERWRESDWKWERFGKLVTVRDCDLWQRVNRALEFHKVECRAWRFQTAPGHDSESESGRDVVSSRAQAETEAASAPAAPGTIPHDEFAREDSTREELRHEPIEQEFFEDRPSIERPSEEVVTPPAMPSPDPSGWISRHDPLYSPAPEKSGRGNFRLTASLAAPLQRISKWFQATTQENNWAGAHTA